MLNLHFYLMILIYLIGMTSFFTVDFVIARYETTEMIAKWATVKSMVMIGGTLSLFGMDQVLVRLPHQALNILKRTILQIIIISLSYIIILATVGLATDLIWDGMAVFVLGISTLLYGFYRSQYALIPAQLTVNAWKFVFLIMLIWAIIFDVEQMYSRYIVVSLVSVLGVVLIVYGFSKQSATWAAEYEIESVKDQYALGGQFFVSLMTLNLSLYLEQILLNLSGKIESSSIYFTHFAIVLPLIVMFNGFSGFLLGPYIRKNTDRFDRFLRKYWWLFPVTALALGVMALFVSIIIYNFFYVEKIRYIPKLAILVVIIGIMRVLYVLPSAYLGVVAPKKMLARFVKVNVLGVLILVAGYYVLVAITGDAVIAVAIASLLNWLTRSAFGLYIVKVVWSERQRLVDY